MKTTTYILAGILYFSTLNESAHAIENNRENTTPQIHNLAPLDNYINNTLPKHIEPRNINNNPENEIGTEYKCAPHLKKIPVINKYYWSTKTLEEKLT